MENHHLPNVLGAARGETSGGSAGAQQIILPLVEDIARRARRVAQAGLSALQELKDFWRSISFSRRKGRRSPSSTTASRWCTSPTADATS